MDIMGNKRWRYTPEQIIPKLAEATSSSRPAMTVTSATWLPLVLSLFIYLQF